MSRTVKITLCATGALLLALFLSPRLDGERAEAAVPVHSAAPVQAAPVQNAAIQEEKQDTGGALLFPDLNAKAITAITVRTPERSFRFAREYDSLVSVNGQQADSEIYMTLVGQIAELPVSPAEQFCASDTKLLLTLIISAGEEQHTASFYEDGGTGATARVIAGTESAPRYGQTDGWRVGTLMMTCEGTRVQDEQGNEQPLSTLSP